MGIMRPERIPLFPLNVVLLPGASLSLHIFEPRYKEMVKDCLEEKSEFGMLLALPKGVAKVGCTAEILEVVKRYSDGHGHCDRGPRSFSSRGTVSRESAAGRAGRLPGGPRSFRKSRAARATRRALRSLPYAALRGLSKKSRRRTGGGTFLSHSQHSPDGSPLETADSRIAFGRGPAGTPGELPSRVGAASTE